MIKIVKPEKPYVPKNGDIGIYGDHHEYLMPLDWEEIKTKNPIPIVGSCSFSMNPWSALRHAGIEEDGILAIKSMALNFCPCADMEYYAIVPIAILAEASVVYVKDHMFANMLGDADWNRQNWISDDEDEYENDSYDPRCPENHLSSVHRAILGSGYHDGILPMDGGHSLIFATIPLDNGDKIIVVGWEWYNK